MKKNNFLAKILAGIAFVSALTSCEDYLDVNTDPNNPTSVTPNLILPAAQHYTADYMHRDRRANHLGNMLMYNWSESNGFSWYDSEFQYNVTTTFYSGLFDDAYLYPLKQYHLLTQNEDPMYVNYAAIGWIMKAFHFQLLVDFYGDIPYSQALGRSVTPTPAYDPAEEVYADLIVKLNAAIDMINNADPVIAVVPGTDDGMFEGDMTAWKQFANTLKVRILTRMSGTDIDNTRNMDLVAAELAKVTAEGSGFIQDDATISPGYLNEADKQNPFFRDFGQDVAGTATMTGNATAATEYIITYLTDTEDPRLDRLYEKPATGHLGIDQGLEPGTEYAPALVSNIGPGLLIGSTQGSIILTLAEHNFNMAELALRSGDVTASESYFEEGVIASFAQLGVSESPFGEATSSNDGYLEQTTNHPAFFASASNDEERLEAIITQKWLAVNGTTAEQSWFDWTRTGYPANLPVSAQALHENRPFRLYYPASETSGNSANVPDQPDAFTTKIFWAQ